MHLMKIKQGFTANLSSFHIETTLLTTFLLECSPVYLICLVGWFHSCHLKGSQQGGTTLCNMVERE